MSVVGDCGSSGAIAVTAESGTSSVVLGWRSGLQGGPASLNELWQRAEAFGWLPSGVEHTVIQIGQHRRSAIAMDTARSLAAFLQHRSPHMRIEILDGGAGRDTWKPLTLRQIAEEETLSLAGVIGTEALTVPALWFESYFLVTVSTATPHPAARLAGILDAQADLLRCLRNPHPTDTLICEARRLAPSDLSVACGYALRNKPESEQWWAVGTTDTAVDQVVAGAAGIEPQALPRCRALARHELLAIVPQLSGSLPPLRAYAAPTWMARTSALRTEARASARAVARDLGMIRRNLHRIPASLGRRLASALRGHGAQ